MGRVSQLLGKQGEGQAVNALRRVGVEMVHRVGTPMILNAISPQMTKQNIFRVVFGEKVAGDHRGVTPDGYSVLAEVKTVFGRNLTWSDFREHQPIMLTEHASHGKAVSLVVWVHDSGVHVLRWPIEGFGPGKGLTAERAMEIEINEV